MTDLATKHGADKASDDAASAHENDEIVDAPDASTDVDASPSEDALDEVDLDDAVEIHAPTAVQTIEVEPLLTDAGDLASADAETVLVATPAAPQIDAGDPGATTFAWAPAEPAPKKRRTGLWIGLAAGAALIGLVATSLVLIAPGTSVGGVAVGGLTQGAAIDAVQERLAEMTIVLTGDGGDAELTGADLGATVDATALAETAFAQHPMWNVTQWFSEPIEAVVQFDDVEATRVLRAAAPDLYTDPVDATLAFDAATVSYVTTPGELGTGIDVAAVRETLQTAFATGQTRVEFDPVSAPVQPETPAFVAESTAAGLNRVLDGAGFYLGADRVVPVPREVAASWITVKPDNRGAFDVSIDEAAIQPVVDTIAGIVNVAPINNAVITDSAGKVLREESNGTPGRAVDDTTDFADQYATQLADFDPVFQLPMTEVPFTTVTLARRIEVNLSSQRAFLFENDQVVKELIISSGVSGSATPKGRFTVNGFSKVQSMGCFDGAPYCVRNVPWVTWFAPDVGFHGASSLRSRLGFPQSHGCVNLWDSDAKFVYDWTARGTEVWVHS